MIRGRRDRREGIVLIVTLWVLTILAVLAITFAGTMHVEARAAANDLQRARALYAAKAGIQRAILAIGQDQTGYASPLSEWAQLSSEDEELPFPGDEAYEVTVTDESGKINLNAADENLLAKLPELSPEMIDSILDWRDPDDDPRHDGAEIDYYSRLQPPRGCANRDFLTLPELLLVKGVRKEAFYGSAIAAPARVGTAAQETTTRGDTPPLEELFTVYGGASDTDAQGQDRLNINLADTQALAERTGDILTEGDLQAIVDYRGAMGAFSSIGDLLRVEGITREKMQQVADLLTTTSKPSGTSGQAGATGAQAGTGETTLPAIPGLETGLPNLGGLTGESTRQFPGGPGEPGGPGGTGGQPGFPSPGAGEPGGPTQPIQPTQPTTNVPDIDTSVLPEASEVRPNVFNLNTAPAEVLATLDGMTEQALNAIVKHRAEQPFTTRGELLALKEVTDALFSQIVEKVTVRSSTLKIVSIGSVEEGRVRVRVTALVDLQGSGPRIVYLAEG